MRVKQVHHKSKQFTKEMAINLKTDVEVIGGTLRGIAPSLHAETVDKMLKAINLLQQEAGEILAEVSR